MPKKRFTNEQIAFALRQAENGGVVAEICEKRGVAEATFYCWREVSTAKQFQASAAA